MCCTNLPSRAQVLNAIWSYRQKHQLDNLLYKYTAQICCNGSQQLYGHDFTNTYTPVVQCWSTIRLIMILASMLGLPSCQVDFTQAFLNANIDTDIYMAIPEGWYYDKNQSKLIQHSDPEHKDYQNIIQLAKNLYGTKQAAHNWCHCLSDNLIKCHGFKASTDDPCLFICDNCFIVLYADDACIFDHDKNVIKNLKQALGLLSLA